MGAGSQHSPSHGQANATVGAAGSVQAADVHPTVAQVWVGARLVPCYPRFASFWPPELTYQMSCHRALVNVCRKGDVDLRKVSDEAG
jgi:hypothetical protein